MNPVKIDTAAMPKIEVRLLCSTLLEQIKAFYEVPENQAAFEAWQRAEDAKRDEEGRA